MVAITEVRSSNASLAQRHESLTAVFVGATSGIGRAALEAFAKHIPQPRAIIVGRSRQAFESDLRRLSTLNSRGIFTFLEADVSLIKNIDAVCERVLSLLDGSLIDLLFTSQGYVGFNGREENADGLDNSVSLRYYGRLRFAQQLLPVLGKNATVLTVLAGGQEGKIIEDDLDLAKHYSIGNAAAQFATMLTLSHDRLAEQNPDQAFLHVFPGLVSTGLLGRSATGVLGVFFRWVVDPLLGLFASKPEEVGERMLFYATNDNVSQGSWSLDWDGTSKEVKDLKEYRERGFADKVVEHNQRMFERALEVR